MGYDIIGSREKAVALIEKGGIKEANKIMKKHKNVKSVLKRGERKGVFRLYPTKLIKGDKNTEVIHRENNVILKLEGIDKLDSKKGIIEIELN